MTNPNYVALCLCVDRSGSMTPIKDDAEGAIKFIINQQRDAPGRCDVMLTQFSSDWQIVYSLRPVQDVPEYFLIPHGSTALLDAIAATITALGAQLADLPEDDRPGKVIVAVQTDGHENASREVTLDRVKEMIAHQRDVYGWEFLFLGANMDAISVGTKMGFRGAQSMTYSADAEGTQNAAGAVSQYVLNTRRTGVAPQNLKANDVEGNCP